MSMSIQFNMVHESLLYLMPFLLPIHTLCLCWLVNEFIENEFLEHINILVFLNLFMHKCKCMCTLLVFHPGHGHREGLHTKIVGSVFFHIAGCYSYTQIIENLFLIDIAGSINYLLSTSSVCISMKFQFGEQSRLSTPPDGCTGIFISF